LESEGDCDIVDLLLVGLVVFFSLTQRIWGIYKGAAAKKMKSKNLHVDSPCLRE
jgi:hypothetical protein